MACTRACIAVTIVATIAASAFSVTSRAQDLGFGLGDAYRRYADPGNGGGSAYTPFFDPYRGNRIVRGAYPDAYYDGYGFHYGKSAPPSLYGDPFSYGLGLNTRHETNVERYRLRDSENETTLDRAPRPRSVRHPRRNSMRLMGSSDYR